MASENVRDRSHGLASWIDSEFGKLDEERQKLIGRLVLRLAADDVSHKSGEVPKGIRDMRSRATLASPDRSDLMAALVKLDELLNMPKREEVDYLKSTNAPLDEFFEIEVVSDQALILRTPRGSRGVNKFFSGDLARRVVERTKSAVSQIPFTATDEPPDNIKPGFLTREQAQAKLDARTQPPDPAETQGEEMLSAREMADYLKASHTTIYNRYHAGRIIGLSQEVGGVVFPKTQFAAKAGPRGPTWLPGLDKVVEVHGNGWPAWLWLNEPRDEFAGETALDRLRAGDHVPVIIALNREEEGAFG